MSVSICWANVTLTLFPFSSTNSFKSSLVFISLIVDCRADLSDASSFCDSPARRVKQNTSQPATPLARGTATQVPQPSTLRSILVKQSPRPSQDIARQATAPSRMHLQNPLTTVCSTHLVGNCSSTSSGHRLVVSASQLLCESSDSDDSFTTSASYFLAHKITLPNQCNLQNCSLESNNCNKYHHCSYDQSSSLEVNTFAPKSIQINVAPATPVSESYILTKHLGTGRSLTKTNISNVKSFPPIPIGGNRQYSRRHHQSNYNTSEMFQEVVTATCKIEPPLTRTSSVGSVSERHTDYTSIHDYEYPNEACVSPEGLCVITSKAESTSLNHSTRPLVIPNKTMKPSYYPSSKNESWNDTYAKPFSTPQHVPILKKDAFTKTRARSVESYGRSLRRALTPRLHRKKKLVPTENDSLTSVKTNETRYIAVEGATLASVRDIELKSSNKFFRKVHTSPQLLTPNSCVTQSISNGQSPSRSSYRPFLTPSFKRRALPSSPQPFFTPDHKRKQKSATGLMNAKVEMAFPKALVRKLSNLNKFSDSLTANEKLPKIDGLSPSPTPYYKKLSLLLAEADQKFTDLQQQNHVQQINTLKCTEKVGQLVKEKCSIQPVVTRNRSSRINRPVDPWNDATGNCKKRDCNSCVRDTTMTCTTCVNCIDCRKCSNVDSSGTWCKQCRYCCNSPPHHLLVLNSPSSVHSPLLTPVTFSSMSLSSSLIPLSPPRSPSCARSSWRLSQYPGKPASPSFMIYIYIYIYNFIYILPL